MTVAELAFTTPEQRAAAPPPPDDTPMYNFERYQARREAERNSALVFNRALLQDIVARDPSLASTPLHQTEADLICWQQRVCGVIADDMNEMVSSTIGLYTKVNGIKSGSQFYKEEGTMPSWATDRFSVEFDWDEELEGPKLILDFDLEEDTEGYQELQTALQQVSPLLITREATLPPPGKRGPKYGPPIGA